MSEDCVLQQGDSRELLRQLPAQSVDLICTDPPYNLGRYSTGNIELSWRADFNNDVAAWDHLVFDPAEWLDEFRRVLKPTGNIFAFTSYNLLGRWHQVFDPVFDTFQFVVWHKTNPPPKLYRAGFLNSCELIVAVWNKGHVWNFGRQRDMHNFIEAPICGGRERLKNPKHPTQKPLAVLRQLIELGSRPGDLVLDPFMGVGSTGVAALELGRRFIGMEIDATYVAASERRIAAATRSMFLGDYGIGSGPAPGQATERSLGRVRSRGSGPVRRTATTPSGEQLGLDDAGSVEPNDAQP
jgi:site-specific DNA-methyltransferase (adenine-specific)/modification methylase